MIPRRPQHTVAWATRNAFMLSPPLPLLLALSVTHLLSPVTPGIMRDFSRGHRPTCHLASIPLRGNLLPNKYIPVVKKNKERVGKYVYVPINVSRASSVNKSSFSRDCSWNQYPIIGIIRRRFEYFFCPSVAINKIIHIRREKNTFFPLNYSCFMQKTPMANKCGNENIWFDQFHCVSNVVEKKLFLMEKNTLAVLILFIE